MRHVISLATILATMLWLSGCGGGSAAAGGAGGPSAGSEAPPSEIPMATPPEGGATGSAAANAPCDFGGAERYTCAAGLTCCYPEQGEVAYGTCVQSCPGYD